MLQPLVKPSSKQILLCKTPFEYEWEPINQSMQKNTRWITTPQHCHQSADLKVHYRLPFGAKSYCIQSNFGAVFLIEELTWSRFQWENREGELFSNLCFKNKDSSRPKTFETVSLVSTFHNRFRTLLFVLVLCLTLFTHWCPSVCFWFVFLPCPLVLITVLNIYYPALALSSLHNHDIWKKIHGWFCCKIVENISIQKFSIYWKFCKLLNFQCRCSNKYYTVMLY